MGGRQLDGLNRWIFSNGTEAEIEKMTKFIVGDCWRGTSNNVGVVGEGR